MPEAHTVEKVDLVSDAKYDEVEASKAPLMEHLLELRKEADELGLSHRVTFLPSFSDGQKAALLEAATAVLYTPQVRGFWLWARGERCVDPPILLSRQNEHFGMVPLEAMAAQRPVIACASGGPLESIVDGVTGFLCQPTPAAFAAAASKLLSDRAGAPSLAFWRRLLHL